MSSIDNNPIAARLTALVKSKSFGDITSTGRLDSHTFRTNSMGGEAILATNMTYVPNTYVSKNTMRLPKVFIFEKLDKKCCIVGFLSANRMEAFMKKVEQERMIPIGSLSSHEYTFETSIEAAQVIASFFIDGSLPVDEPLKRRDFFS